ncbi:helix-turn-helix transcriptional regulator [Carboxylicivirga mesophila]|uniref:Helix-turn-helix transcriptional regulator n=1 Tax=Carboxylicivirga mesophila TaxID=1166478 RepID=A0ABS5KFU4_9BACT|nr:helix-turn-helix transcriptional regulator [Carboxylicivirga mesophila]MBS2213891.1 helix-turn-helix transcriptional regulator [Carboxylicivirga mesophila]
MLAYNFDRIFKAKGIDRPFAFLRKVGFSDNFATRVKHNRVKRLDPVLIERLCIAFGCTPNDLMEWQPDKDSEVSDAHPLQQLRRTEKLFDLTKSLSALPLNKLNEIEQILNKMS